MANWPRQLKTAQKSPTNVDVIMAAPALNCTMEKVDKSQTNVNVIMH